MPSLFTHAGSLIAISSLLTSISISLTILDFEVVNVQNIFTANFSFEMIVFLEINFGFDLVLRTAISKNPGTASVRLNVRLNSRRSLADPG